MKVSLVLIFGVLITISNVQGILKCYICSQSGASDENACLNNPNALGDSAKFVCKKKFCTIFRQDLKDPPVLASFARGCEDAPVFLNKNVKDGTYNTFYRACTKSLCNNGTGKEPIVGNGFGQEIGPAGVLLVPGIGDKSNGQPTKVNFLMFVCIVTLGINTKQYFAK